MYSKIYDYDWKNPDIVNKIIYSIYPKKYKKIVVIG